MPGGTTDCLFMKVYEKANVFLLSVLKSGGQCLNADRARLAYGIEEEVRLVEERRVYASWQLPSSATYASGVSSLSTLSARPVNCPARPSRESSSWARGIVGSSATRVTTMAMRVARSTGRSLTMTDACISCWPPPVPLGSEWTCLPPPRVGMRSHTRGWPVRCSPAHFLGQLHAQNMPVAVLPGSLTRLTPVGNRAVRTPVEPTSLAVRSSH